MELFSGGTEVTVHGSNLDSVAEPRITLTVVTTWLYNDTNVKLGLETINCLCHHRIIIQHIPLGHHSMREEISTQLEATLPKHYWRKV